MISSEPYASFGKQRFKKINELNIRTCCIRTGLVLAKEGGALPQMSKPVKMGFGAKLGNGKQWMS